AALAPEEVVHAAVDVAPDLVEIGRSATAAATALAPLGIVQRHGVLGGSRRGKMVRDPRASRTGELAAVQRGGACAWSEFGAVWIVFSRGNRSASAARNSAHPAPVNALVRTVEMVPQPSRSTPAASPARSHLFSTRICGTLSASIAASTSSTAAI